MATFEVKLDRVSAEAHLIKVGFGAAGTNCEIVKDCELQIKDLKLKGGKLLLINGACTLPAAFCICNNVKHLYQNVAVYDPKLTAYVVCINNGGSYDVGSKIDDADVKHLDDE